MKLYYSAGACSLSPPIALEEAGLPYEAISAPTKTKQLPDGSDFRQVNPLGYVPYLVLDDGTGLSEGPAIVQYIADQAPAKKLAPANGTLARYQLQSLLNFIGTELHKSCSPFFNPASGKEWKEIASANLERRLAYVNEQLEGKPYLMGEDFSVADGYLFTVLGWMKFVRIDLAKWPNLAAFVDRVAARPAVKAALKAEQGA